MCRGEAMDVETTNTITAVDKKEWEPLAGTDIERSYDWHKTVEESGLKKMYYIFVRENKKLQAAACSYLSTEKMYIEMPFLEVRSPLGTSLAFYSRSPEHTDVLMKGLENVQKKEKAKGIMVLDLKKEEYHTLKRQMKGFAQFFIDENTYIDLNFSDFEDYLSSLDGKARRSVRNTLNKAKRLDIKSIFTSEFSHWKEAAHRLQGYTCEEHNDYRWHLPERFYEALEVNLKENAELLVFLKENVPFVFALLLNTPETVLYKFMGSDPAYKRYQAYFLIYYEGIRKALERKQKRIYFGPTTYAFKEKIGCKREALFGLAKLENPLLNGILRSCTAVSRVVGIRF